MADNNLYPKFTNVGGLDYRLRRLEVGSQRQRAGQLQPSNGAYARIPTSALRKGFDIDLSISTIRKVGSLPPSGNVSGFAYVGGANSITWYWDGTHGSTVIVLHRSDSTIQVIPTVGSGLQVTGLLGATTYYFLPYWTPNQGCNVSWVTGTVGTPQIAFTAFDKTSVSLGSFYLLQQSLQDREPLTAGWMSATTGSSGGGGGGGGGGNCVMSGTEVIPLGGLEYKIEVLGETEWVHLVADNGKELNCTHNHPLYHELYGKQRADSFYKGDPIITDSGVRYITSVDWFSRKCSKHKVVMPDGHLYYANGFLSHNQKPVNP